MLSITSRDNPNYKILRELSVSARERRSRQQTVLDGIHLIDSALSARWRLRSIWVGESALSHPEVVAVLARCNDSSVIRVPDALLNAAAPTETPSGILAVIDIPAGETDQTTIGSVLVLDGVQDAGNVGSMMRTAAAAGIKRVWLTPGCAQAWSPKVLRAGMGAHFVIQIAENQDVIARLADSKQPVIGTSLQGAQSLYEADLCGDVIWLFGAEGAGLSAPLLERATTRVRIPMAGPMESLNVAAAAAICLFEQARRRQ